MPPAKKLTGAKRNCEENKGTIFFKKKLPQSVAEQEKIHILAP